MSYNKYLASLVSGVDPSADLLSQVAGIDPLVGALSLPGLSSAAVNAAAGIQALQAAKSTEILQKAQARSLLEKQPTIPLGIDSATVVPLGVPAGGTVIIPVQPGVSVRLVDISVDVASAANFLINDIFTGTYHFNPSGQPLPATAFLPNSTRPPLELPQVPGGVPIQVSVTNISGGLARFVAAFFAINLQQANV